MRLLINIINVCYQKLHLGLYLNCCQNTNNSIVIEKYYIGFHLAFHFLYHFNRTFHATVSTQCKSWRHDTCRSKAELHQTFGFCLTTMSLHLHHTDNKPTNPGIRHGLSNAPNVATKRQRFCDLLAAGQTFLTQSHSINQ